MPWQGICLYARLQVTPVFAFTPRFEYLDDRDAFMTGTSQKPKELTFTAEAKVAGGPLARFELRRDFSDQAFFTDASGVLKKGRTTLTASAVYSFATKF